MGHKLYGGARHLDPRRARIGLGIYTQLPIRDRRSRSLAGQGMSARRSSAPGQRCRGERTHENPAPRPPGRRSRRSLAFYTAVGYEVVGRVPETPFGRLTMLKLPGDDFVTIELVHDPTKVT